jgi:hypothetical protein
VSHQDSLEDDFWLAFDAVMGRPYGPAPCRQAQVPEWDSLRHVELIFELEEKCRVTIAPGAIAALFSDTDTILAHLRACKTGVA